MKLTIHQLNSYILFIHELTQSITKKYRDVLKDIFKMLECPLVLELRIVALNSKWY
ncbi:MAG: hypothetical protein LBK06_10155 [Planctomycetaceae bacterium]|nr:hypothetical protein [Planctomycetaceae bacterium]